MSGPRNDGAASAARGRRPRTRGSRLEFDAVVGGYGGVAVVRGVSGAVAAGEVLCVIGRNGVGKSTLMKLLFGELPCREGSVRFEGRAIERLETAQRHALGIGYCPQERPVFDDLSVRDNLTLMRADRRLDAFAPLFARFPILPRRLEQHAGTLSAARRRSSRSRAASPKRSRCCCSTSRAKACSGRTSCTWRRDRRAKARRPPSWSSSRTLRSRSGSRTATWSSSRGASVLEGRREEVGRERLLEYLQV